MLQLKLLVWMESKARRRSRAISGSKKVVNVAGSGVSSGPFQASQKQCNGGWSAYSAYDAVVIVNLKSAIPFVKYVLTILSHFMFNS